MQIDFLTQRREFLNTLGVGLLTPAWLCDDQTSASANSESAFVDWKELAEQGARFEHWTPEQDHTWKWYTLERYKNGSWKTVGRTLPINLKTGEPFDKPEEYLSPDAVPEYVLESNLPTLPKQLRKSLKPSQWDAVGQESHQPDPLIRARDGKPPSDWLTSLHAAELRTWLATIEPSEAGVSGMTYWVHLVRDHGFDPRHINGLTEDEFQILHSAAHEGY